MKKIILFSAPVPFILEKLLNELFPKELENKVFAYMPSDGSETLANEKFTPVWQQYAIDKGVTKFNFIDNSKLEKDSSPETEMLEESNILIITGGNTFALLRNLKRSGLDRAVQKFVKKDNFILAGFSAGALVLTPNINICSLECFDKNLVELNDLQALNIVDFEVFPHFKPEYAPILDEYKKKTTNKVKIITNEEMIII